MNAIRASSSPQRSVEKRAADRESRIQQYVSFRVADQLLGIPVDIVQEVLNPQTIARTPCAPREIAGLLNLRGQIVTAVNLRRRLQLPDLPAGKPSMNVVLRFQGEAFSLLVDEVEDVIDVDRRAIDAVPPTLDANWKSVTRGVVCLQEELLVILNVEALLTLSPT